MHWESNIAATLMHSHSLACYCTFATLEKAKIQTSMKRLCIPSTSIVTDKVHGSITLSLNAMCMCVDVNDSS